MLVVVADVGREHSFEVASVDDQDPVEALAAYGADPPFGERVGAGRPSRCADDRDAVGAEHLVEPGCELAVAVVEQEPGWLDERLDEVPRLLGRPLTARVHGDACQIDLPGRELDEDECVEPAAQHGVDREEVAGDDSAGLGSQELPPSLGGPSGAGSIPACCRIDQTVLAAIRMPRPASSPWIRR
jgi:hypothetical protein